MIAIPFPLRKERLLPEDIEYQCVCGKHGYVSPVLIEMISELAALGLVLDSIECECGYHHELDRSATIEEE